MFTKENGHLSAQALQDYLENGLSRQDEARAEEHLGSCSRCSAELEAWRALVTHLDGLEANAAPSASFAERVLAEVPVQRSRWHRLRGWLAHRVPALQPADARGDGRFAGRSGHPSSDRLQDLAEGLVPEQLRPRIEAHVARCALCTREVDDWRGLMGSVGSLPYAAPSSDFREQVMAQVQPATQTAKDGVGADGAEESPLWAWVDRGVDRVGRLIPETPRGRMAVGALLLAPVAAVAVVLHYLTRQPSLDLQSLVAYSWWQISESLSVLAAYAVARLLESPAVLRVLDWAAAAVSAPGASLAAIATMWALCLGAAWVLYRNVITPQTSTTGSHVRT